MVRYTLTLGTLSHNVSRSFSSRMEHHGDTQTKKKIVRSRSGAAITHHHPHNSQQQFTGTIVNTTMISTIVSSSLRRAASSSVALVSQRQLSMTATQSADKLTSIFEEYRAQQ